MTAELFLPDDSNVVEYPVIIIAGKLYQGGERIRPTIGDSSHAKAMKAREIIDKGVAPIFTTGRASKFSQWSSSAMLTCPYCNKTHSGQGSGPTKSDAERLACNDFHKHTCRCGCQFRVDGRKIHQQD